MNRGALEGPRRLGLDDEGLDTVGIIGLLQLLGAGASSAILLALGEEPLRTMELTARVPGYSPRTVYRYVSRLADIGANTREEEPGVPTKVVHSLTDPCGTDLYKLIKLYSKSSTLLERLQNGGIVPQSWNALTLLAGLWESGMFEELNAGPCTATELAGVDHDLSFHQVTRRISLLMIGGMIQHSEAGRTRRHYELTRQAREATALIAGLGQWRERYAVPPGDPGLTTGEVVELLRSALPLLVLPAHADKCFELTVDPSGDGIGGERRILWAEVKMNGAVVISNTQIETDSWGRGVVREWIKVLLGGSNKVRSGGSGGSTANACLLGMGPALWPPDRHAVL
jgi:DNA-binding HxlR family transcriptional regulator